MTTWEGEAASASVYCAAHTFLLVPANTENKFSDNSMNTSPIFTLQSQPRHYSNLSASSYKCYAYFPMLSNLTNLREKIYYSIFFSAQHKTSSISTLPKMFSSDCAKMGKMRWWQHKKDSKTKPGNPRLVTGALKSSPAFSKKGKKTVINVALQLSDIQTASSYSLIL